MGIHQQTQSRTTAWLAIPHSGGARWLVLIVLAFVLGAALSGGLMIRFSGPPDPAAAMLLPPEQSACTNGAPDGRCDDGERRRGTCPEDCGQPSGDQGGDDTGGTGGCDNDQVCEPENGEATFNCGDCLSVCGDDICSREEVDSCEADCPVDVTCGDGICSAFENRENCPNECPEGGTTTGGGTAGGPQPTDTPVASESGSNLPEPPFVCPMVAALPLWQVFGALALLFLILMVFFRMRLGSFTSFATFLVVLLFLFLVGAGMCKYSDDQATVQYREGLANYVAPTFVWDMIVLESGESMSDMIPAEEGDNESIQVMRGHWDGTMFVGDPKGMEFILTLFMDGEPKGTAAGDLRLDGLGTGLGCGEVNCYWKTFLTSEDQVRILWTELHPGDSMGDPILLGLANYQAPMFVWDETLLGPDDAVSDVMPQAPMELPDGTIEDNKAVVLRRGMWVEGEFIEDPDGMEFLITLLVDGIPKVTSSGPLVPDGSGACMWCRDAMPGGFGLPVELELEIAPQGAGEFNCYFKTSLNAQGGVEVLWTMFHPEEH